MVIFCGTIPQFSNFIDLIVFNSIDFTVNLKETPFGNNLR